MSVSGITKQALEWRASGLAMESAMASTGNRRACTVATASASRPELLPSPTAIRRSSASIDAICCAAMPGTESSSTQRVRKFDQSVRQDTTVTGAAAAPAEEVDSASPRPTGAPPLSSVSASTVRLQLLDGEHRRIGHRIQGLGGILPARAADPVPVLARALAVGALRIRSGAAETAAATRRTRKTRTPWRSGSAWRAARGFRSRPARRFERRSGSVRPARTPRCASGGD